MPLGGAFMVRLSSAIPALTPPFALLLARALFLVLFSISRLSSVLLLGSPGSCCAISVS